VEGGKCNDELFGTLGRKESAKEEEDEDFPDSMGRGSDLCAKTMLPPSLIPILVDLANFDGGQK
jgi:hypothetical protein